MIKLSSFLLLIISLDLMLVKVSLGQEQVFIVGGEPTYIEKSPYLMQIFRAGQFHCSGTLISVLFVVTACHCTHNVRKESLVVKGGATFLTEHGVTSLVSGITEPAHFTTQNMDFDVAVLKLATPMIGNSIQPIALSTTGVQPGEPVQILGWGTKRDITDYTSVQLFESFLTVVRQDVCKAMYRNIMNITENMFCAYGQGRSTCTGDSGGSVVAKGKLVGIVSFGINCGVNNNFPAVFGNVSHFISFIQKAIQQ